MAGSGVFAKVGGAVGAKTVGVVAAGVVAVSAAAGAGVWWVSRGPDAVAVVERSTSVAVPAGGERLTVAGCLAHETAIGGGYAIAGPGFATNSHFIGGAWLASAFNPGSDGATLTSYALCVNAKAELEPGLDFTWRAHAFRDRGNKLPNSRFDGNIHDLTTDGPLAGVPGNAVATPSCGGGYTMVGAEFRAGRILGDRAVAPVPLDRLMPGAGTGTAAFWEVSVNPGTELSNRSFPMSDSSDVVRRTRIVDPQPPQANFAVGVRPVCVKVNDWSVASVEVPVAAGGAAEAVVRCPKGRLVVGGGFRFPARNESGAPEAPQRFFGDGWLYASADAPVAAGVPSGRTVRDWHVTGVDQQRAGALYRDSVWIEHGDRETLTGNGYFDERAHGADDQELRTSAMPAAQPLVAGVVCGSIPGAPTSPSKGASAPVPVRPELPSAAVVPPGPTAVTVSPGASPGVSPGSSPGSSPGASPGASAGAGTPSVPGRSPVPSSRTSGPPDGTGVPGTPGRTSSAPPAQPQPPVVSIQRPGAGGQLRRGCEEAFAGTARTRPGDRPLTDPQYTAWRLTGPDGPVVLGAGPSGGFVVPLLPDGTYPLTFTATDPDSGLTATARVSVRVVGCLR
ncbi:hypothetical protein [Streptomyces sp. SPB4]|uniref:hypothetical protein n=1 Tax=Streptomyces sp. SPB4 TaxID=2940553 RepID=UPI0024730BE5|nr:hypothetical protein [Streptomyces sp. SPB4]MDH6538912.1 hypothetical protein [Streptomyces sp. SPB4]